MRLHLSRSGNNGARLLLAGTVLLAAALGAGAGIASLPAEEASVSASPPAPPLSAASLNINPKRIVLDRTGKSATVYLFNQGDSAGLFDITLVDRVMLPSGQIISAEDARSQPEASESLSRMNSAQAMLVATPRRVRLAPHSGQTIRIRASGDGTLAPGEYRTHLTIAAVPPPDTGVTADQAAKQEPGALSFRIASIIGVSLPVILRNGPADVRAAIEQARVTTENLSLDGKSPPRPTAVATFDLVRTGKSSLFGDIELRAAKGRSGKDGGEVIGLMRGVGVYPEIDRRHVRLVLSRQPQPGETLSLSFNDDDTTPGKRLVQTPLVLP